MDSRDRRGRDNGGFRDCADGLAPFRPLSVVQGVSCYCGAVVDGRHALPSTAIRLPLRSGERLTPVRNAHGDGTAPAARAYQSRHYGSLGAWAVDCLSWGLAFPALGAFATVACC